jgi:hypothetical protein
MKLPNNDYTTGSADWRISIRDSIGPRIWKHARARLRFADWQSATRQVGNLRYLASAAAAKECQRIFLQAFPNHLVTIRQFCNKTSA